MREQFENMPEVHKKLKDLHPTIVWFSDQENKYASSFEGFQNMVIWLNGAWYAYQEQQKNIDAIIKWVEEDKKSIPLSEWHGYTTEEYVDADDLLELLK